jgi:hypothetical protein
MAQGLSRVEAQAAHTCDPSMWPGGLPVLTLRYQCRTRMELSWPNMAGPRYWNTLTKLASNLSRLGKSNPRPTHYE